MTLVIKRTYLNLIILTTINIIILLPAFHFVDMAKQMDSIRDECSKESVIDDSGCFSRYNPDISFNANIASVFCASGMSTGIFTILYVIKMQNLVRIVN